MTAALPSRSSWHAPLGQQAVMGAAVFGVLWAAIEFGLGSRLHRPYDGLEIVWWRYGAHLAVVALIWGKLRPTNVWRTERRLFQIARSMLMVVMPLSYLVGVHFAVPSNFMSSVFWTAPLLIGLGGWSVLGERPSILMLAICAAGAAVVAVMDTPAASQNLLAVGCAAGMTLSFAAYVLMTRSLRTDRVEANLFYTAFGPFVVLTAIMPLIWQRPDAHDAAIMTAIGIVGFAALYALDRSAYVAPVWVGAPGVLAQVVTMIVIVSVSGGVAPPLRSTLAACILVVLIGAALVVARREMHARRIEQR